MFGTPHTRSATRLVQIARCERGATAAEFAVILGLIVMAAGSVHSPRLHTVKDRDCIGQRCARPAPDKAASLRASSIRQKPEKFRSFER